jgi:hypothetical protein
MVILLSGGHVYTVDGEVKQSVTQMLKSVGIVECSGIPEYYADRGTAVHDYCTLYVQGWLDWTEVRKDCLPFVRTFQRLVWELGLSYVSAEQPSYDPEYDICGKYDLIMMWKGKRVLVELKTTDFPMWGGLQLASYERMVEVDDVMGMALKEGKVYVKADDYQKNHDTLADIHSGFFDLARWKANRKRRHMKVLKEIA